MPGKRVITTVYAKKLTAASTERAVKTGSTSAREHENATDQLRRRSERSDSLRESRDEVRRVVRVASEIDRAIRRGRVGGGVQRSWSNLRSEINALARAYNIRSILASPES